MKKFLVNMVLCIYLSMSILSQNALAYDNGTSITEIKVGLKNMLANSVKISLDGDYKIDDITLPKGSILNVSISGGKICIGDKLYNSGVMLTPINSISTITLSNGPRKYRYLGNMTFKVSGSRLLPINTLDVESYLKGVVGYEMSNSYPIEALKAQAVSARGYAIANVDKHRKEEFDICDTTDCQVYKGYNSEYKNVIKSVDDTKGQVLYYGDDIISAYFAASDGGYTEASQNVWTSSLPYLITKKDDFDNEAWPYGDKKMTSSEIQTILLQKRYLSKGDKFLKLDIDNIKRYESSRIESIDIIYQNSSGEVKRKSVVKDATRYFLSFPSSMYTVTYDKTGDTYNFSGKGYGHGVGMSQIGARNRAKAGQTYDQILKFYYDGTVIRGIQEESKPDTINKSKSASISISKPISVPSKINTIALDETAVVAKNDSSVITGLVVRTNISDDNVAIKKGMIGNDVKAVQQLLYKLGYYRGRVNSVFDTQTFNSVKSFQKANSISQTGIVDKITMLKIKDKVKAKENESKSPKSIIVGLPGTF